MSLVIHTVKAIESIMLPSDRSSMITVA